MELFKISVMIFTLFLFLLLSRDWKKYKENIPYKISKTKKNIFLRIILGIVAGFHYFHFIGTYTRKKYQTQVFIPKTLECFVAVIFAFLLWVAYLLTAKYLQSLIGNYGLLILLIPLITNSISIIKKK